MLRMDKVADDAALAGHDSPSFLILVLLLREIFAAGVFSPSFPKISVALKSTFATDTSGQKQNNTGYLCIVSTYYL